MQNSRILKKKSQLFIRWGETPEEMFSDEMVSFKKAFLVAFNSFDNRAVLTSADFREICLCYPDDDDDAATSNTSFWQKQTKNNHPIKCFNHYLIAERMKINKVSEHVTTVI